MPAPSPEQWWRSFAGQDARNRPNFRIWAIAGSVGLMTGSSPRPSRSKGGAIARRNAMVLNSCQRCLMVGQGGEQVCLKLRDW